MTARVLATGGAGQVGQELARRDGVHGMSVTALVRADLDVTDEAAVRRAFERHHPDIVINPAAYTAVDRAESDAETAFAVNEGGARALALACAMRGIPLVHLSTDYVFDGTKPDPYLETDPASPLGTYGRSKHAGEEAVRAALEHHVILRTSWVYAAHGANFLRTMLRVGSARDSLEVVDDQHGAPTWAGDIAAAALHIADRILNERATDWGICHYTARGSTTWHGFARAIFDEAAAVTGRKPAVTAIPTSAWPTPAARPANSRLDCSRVDRLFAPERPHWRASLSQVLAGMLGTARTDGGRPG